MWLPSYFPDLVIDRPEKFGGRVTFSTYEELKEAYMKEQVYPLDLKNSVANQLNLVFFFWFTSQTVASFEPLTLDVGTN